MVVRRVAAAALGVVLSFASVVAQESAREFPSEVVSNWTAPPYWNPLEAVGKNVEGLLLEGEDLGVEPMAVPLAPLPFIAFTPCRIVDTRGANGSFGGPALAANATRSFNLPAGPCLGLPADAGAWSLNFTVIGGAGTFQGGYLTAWPTGSAQPLVSTLNFNANQLEANAAVVPAGTSGSINVFVNAPGHLLIDINGYYQNVGVMNTLNSLSGHVTLAEGTNITITPAGQTLTIAANTLPPPPAWSLTGNAGTAPGTNYLGTTDNQRLELQVNGQRVLRLEPPPFATTTPNLVGGHAVNSVTAGATGATIGGGGYSGFANRVTDSFGTVGGGSGNQAGDNAGTQGDRTRSTVGGGSQNTASGSTSTIAGGTVNVASGAYGFVGGGAQNSAGNSGAVAGGQLNIASGNYASVPGGFRNSALGEYSFAAGQRGKANHNGAFVWGDSTLADVASTGVNQFIVRASGGIWLGTTSAPALPGTDFLNTSTGAHLTTTGIWTNNSDRAAKENLQPIDQRALLSRLASLPVSTWSYKADNGSIRHIGPMAQDFAAAFGVGNDDRSIGTLDADGVALAAIQALYEVVQEKDRRIEALEMRLSRIEEFVK